MSSRRNEMDEASKELIKRTKEIIDSGLKNYPDYYKRRYIIDRIRADRALLKAITRCVEVNNYTFNSRLSKKVEFRTFISKGNYFKIIDIDDSEELKITHISKLYANLGVINTVIVNENKIFLTNNMAIRLLNDPDNEVWLYESELSELY